MNPDEIIAMSLASAKRNDEIITIADAAATKAVSALLLTIGVDASEPQQVLKMQRDFANLRRWGDSMDLVRTRGLVTAVGVIVAGVLSLVWLALRGH